LEFKPQGADWQWLAAWGLPWEETPGATAKTRADLPRLKREAVAAWTEAEQSPSSRRGEALIAFLLALRDHFPTAFRQCFRRTALERWLEAQVVTGRIIKQRRIAIARLAEIL
jgi:hypothetical protein